MTEAPTFEKVIRDDKVAVLVSPGWGAGWSTWNSEYRDFLIFDSGLIGLLEANASNDKVEAYLTEKLGEDHNIYMGGWPAEIEWLPVGTAFYIHEYDGYESLRTTEDLVITA